MRKQVISALMAGTMVLGLAGSATAAYADASDGIFRYAETIDPTTLDPSKADSILDNEMIHVSQAGLVRNTAGDIQPDIAESWDVSDDGLVYTFHLRDALWSDGEPIKADDYVYGIQRLLDPATASEYAFIGEYVKNGAAVEAGELAPEEVGAVALDDKTVEITLEQPTSYFLSLIGSAAQYMPVRRDIVEQFGTDFAATADKNVYSGPFVISSTDAGSYLYEKNPNYWNADAIKLNGAEVIVVSDTSTQVAMFEQGDIDFVKVPTDSVPMYDDIDHEYMNGNEDYFYINEESTNPILSDRNFRLALNYALNRNLYIQLATNNVYSASNTLVMPLVAGYDGQNYGESYELSSYPLDGDQDKALEYLQAAMDANGISDPSEISVEITTTDVESSKKIAEVAQELLQQALGINITIRQVTYADIYGSVLPGGDYEIGFGGWGPDYSDPYTYLELFKSDCSYNYSNYVNADFDALLDASRTETDEKARMDLLNQAETIILEDGAFIPLQCRQQHYLLNEDVTGMNFYFCSINTDWTYASFGE